MKRLALLLFVIAYLNGYTQMSPGVNNTTIKVLSNGFEFACKIYVPADWNQASTKKYPVIIEWHSTGEAGPRDGSQINNLNFAGFMYNINQGILPTAVHNGVTYDFIVVKPQAESYAIQPEYWHWIYEDLIQRRLKVTGSSAHKIDTDRIYSTGASSGGKPGFGTVTNLGNGAVPASDSTYAKLFSAMTPMSPATQDIITGGFVNFSKWGIRVLSFAGSADQPYLGNAQNAVANINSYGGGMGTVLSIPGYGHQVELWNYYTDKNHQIPGIGMTMLEWFLQYSKSPTPPNILPVANAGPDVSIISPVSSATLYGSGSDADGAIISYQWAKISGPSAGTISSPFTAQTGLTGLVVGTYVFRLTVTDDRGGTHGDNATVTVNQNTMPTANAGADFSEPDSIPFTMLSGSGTGSGISYRWRVIQKPNGNDWCANILNPTQTSTQAMFTGVFGVYKYELTVQDASAQVAKDTITVTKTYSLGAAPQSTGWRYASASDVSTIPNANLNDIIIDGANIDNYGPSGTKVSIVYQETSGMKLVPGRKILIKGGKYLEIRIMIHADSNTATSDNKAIITNYGGQVQTRKLRFSNLENIKITGEYNPTAKTGDINFQGHRAGYAYSSGKYGIFLNDQWINPDNFIFSAVEGDQIHDVEVSFLEIGNGGFAPVVGKTGGALDVNNFVFHDNYVHDMHGEGFYGMRTEGDPQPQMNGWHFYNNRFIRSGNEGAQFSQMGENNNVSNNVFYMNALNWYSAFHDSQVFGLQLGPREKGGHMIRGNIVLGAGEQLLSVITNQQNGRPTNGATSYIRSNVFQQSRGSASMYVGKQDTGFFRFAIDSNFSGFHTFSANRIFTDSRGTNSNDVWRLGQGVTPDNNFLFTGNRYDGTKTNFISTSLGVTVNTNNANNPGHRPAFVNSGWPDTMNLGRVSMWADTIFGTSKKEYLNITGTRQGQPLVYGVDEYVFHLGKCYRSKVYPNQGHPPAGVTDTYWELITWNGSFLPPDDFRLTAADAYGARSIGLTDNLYTNILPTVDAGPNQTITYPSVQFQLNSTASDADGVVANFAWAKVGGPSGATLNNANAEDPVLTVTSAGVYTYQVTVTDNAGGTATDNVTLTVLAAANQPPVANAGPDYSFRLPQSSTTLSGMGTDPDGSIVGYNWVKLTGPSVTISNANIQYPTASAMSAGVYTFKLTVEDNEGATDTDTLQITVIANTPPVANAGPDRSINLPLTYLTLAGSGTDPDGTIATYAWVRISGPTSHTFNSSSIATPLISNLVSGTYVFQLTVTDNGGLTHSDQITVNVVTPTPPSPVKIPGRKIIVEEQ